MIICNSEGIKMIKVKEMIAVVELVLKKIKKADFDVSINFVSGAKIKLLNNKFRQKNKITDVLSFATLEGQKIGVSKELGDIFICLPQIKRQAKENKIDFEEELVRMIVHGILHLAGYDHVKKNDEKKMFGLQEKLVVEIRELSNK